MSNSVDRPVILAMTGASGAPYALRLLQCLLEKQRPVYLLVSKAAQMVLQMESDLDIPGRPAEMQTWLSEYYQADSNLLTVFGREQWTASIASGSHNARHMVICPCTTGTLAAVANGNSDNLIERAADVMLKEQRKLIMVVREMPLSVIHLENMLRLARAGATIMPANPGFYYQPQSVEDLVDFVVARILDHLEVEHTLVTRWGEAPG
ncbi:flavin prenyltransferase UbiX [Thiohalophilus thiocyanatoxydans]|uniref:Flavin prenyltransferase UbiX n=1 Tax=Thiohalophilus thiocyanatoxydans TaxID=381308 RepID=A0A4R8ISF2_9GAMM|nr:flavin prenyltransferase UbiX [Thiohalophilus thiocyanatoxydans]TDY00469.1 4-hydroxy-3-polyprenylbenzoate decarboxylase [Thiohalophilus thiocyanatoxydans]